jgi:indole-3-glycerol phosphate synthase
MTGFLAQIVGEVRSDLDRADYDADLPDRPPRTPASLRERILARGREGSIIAEYKRVSPGQQASRLPARSVDDFSSVTDDPSVVGYSCLATRPHFDGSPRDVAALARLSSRPVLFKDFTIDPRQIDVAARAGAGAILLIARLSEREHGGVDLGTMADRAHAKGLEVLLEFHSEAELSLADRVRADIYGVNVRDLDTLEIERGTAEQTLDLAGERGLRPLVGMSGVDGPAEAARFWERGVDAILVGTALARSSDPIGLVRSLRPQKEKRHG